METNNILTLFKKNKIVNDILKKTKEDQYNLLCNGVTLYHAILLSSSIYSSNNNFIVYVCSNAFQANKAYDVFCDVLGYENINLYVVDDFVATEAVVISNELKQERLNTIKNIINNQPKIIVTHIAALLRPVVSLKQIKKNQINLKIGNEIYINDLIKRLIDFGYSRKHTTYNIGEFSVRGEVIDIFPSCSEKPVRINFEFDEIVSLKEFDLDTQMTIANKYSSLQILPMNEIVLDCTVEELENKLLKIESSDYIKNDFIDVIESKSYDKLNKYIDYIDKDNCYFVNYFNKNFIMINDEIKDIHDIAEAIYTESYNYKVERLPLKKCNIVFYKSLEEMYSYCTKQIYLSQTKKVLSKLELMGIYELNGYKVIDYQNDLKELVNDLKQKTDLVFLTFQNENQMSLIKDVFNENDVKYNILNDFFSVEKPGINLIICPNAIGYGIHSNYLVITDREIFKKAKIKHAKYRSVKENSISINSKEDLHVGDYVVHYDYGIAKYLGIKTVDLNNNKNDYLQLQYDNVTLLVPIEKITELEKYIGAEGVIPKLTKVGTNEWEKRKSIVKEQLECIAKELIELQVKREKMSGYKYQTDSDFQKLFEDDFEYEETPDQIKITDEIKKEMERGILIDRLICGDVGFGKTEIAMRIAFKTIYEGKQVAFMAPTTILTRQHYYTFKERFEKYGIKIALLNRLVPIGTQNKIIKDLKEGKIDVVIGTHRLLNNEIKYKDLGLLVVDEEQRFGVMHKEKIKQMKNNVNVLTLTATPIPRTLQMAVTGIRSLSLLETPPKDRYPIQTYVLQHSDAIIKDAIYRELARNGQVFYLHNRVSDIQLVAKKIKRLVPEAKICIGHGKMNRDELEDIVGNFIEGQYNVMVCTTIIETGIDIPNSNTLIVEDASKLGLAQMYQIRGRVGRSDRIAYAFFTYSPDKVVSGTAQKRLLSIKEFTKIGSGYKIAVRDLAIRGAGDILGREQSGFINSLGIDMYMKLLNEVVNKVKGIEETKQANYKIEVSKHVEREYVDDDTIIIYIHKEINHIRTKEDKNNTIKELVDRFGKLSQNVLDYIEERYLEAQLHSIMVLKVIETSNLATIIIPKQKSETLKGDKVLMAGYELSERFSFEYKDGQYVVRIKKEQTDKSWIYLMNSFLEKIV